MVPRYFVQPQTPYKPTDVNPGEVGISFPSSDKAYIIIFPISPAAIIKSVRLPKTSNVDQMRVMFLDEQDNPILAQPSDTVPLQITSKLETNPTISVNLPTKVYAVHITLIHTSNNQPPQGVTVEIVVCAESLTTTAQTTMTTAKTVTTPGTNNTSSTSQTTVTKTKTVTTPSTYDISSTPCKNIKLFNYIITFSLMFLAPSDQCKPKQNASTYITIGECISQQEIQQYSCAGYCSSYEQLDPVSGNVTEKECLCCAPDVTYTESIVMNCLNATTGQSEQRTSQIIRIQSCKCSICLGSTGKSDSNDKTANETSDITNRSKTKTKTRRR